MYTSFLKDYVQERSCVLDPPELKYQFHRLYACDKHPMRNGLLNSFVPLVGSVDEKSLL